MLRIDVAQLQMLREAARERSRHIAHRMDQIEAGRLRLWTRMDRLRAELDAQMHDAAWGAAEADAAPAENEGRVRLLPA